MKKINSNRFFRKVNRFSVVRCSLYALFLFSLFSFRVVAESPAAPPVSHWMHPTGGARPIHIPRVINATFSQSSLVTHDEFSDDTRRVCIIVSSNIFESIGSSLETLQADLADQGYDPIVTRFDGGSPEELRMYLATLYSSQQSLEGAVLVGDIPWIIYELMQDWDGPNGNPPDYEDFPCDIFFMDLDGTWQDSLDNGDVQPGNGKYDVHSGKVDLEIWVSRIKSDNLTTLGSESGIVVSYLDRNHRYRQHLLRPSLHALVYNDDDWSTMADNDALNLSAVYDPGNVMMVDDRETTTAWDYKNNRITGNFEFIALRSHGYSGGHGFYRNNQLDMDYVEADDYPQLHAEALFYSLYVCSGADFSHNNYLAGMITFAPGDAGLVCIGSTKTGGMFEESLFYEQLAAGNVIGDAFIEWFNWIQSLDLPAFVQPWFYGMVLIGDASLKPRAHGLPAASIVSPHAGEQYSVYAGLHSTNIFGFVTDIPDSLTWYNTLTGTSGVLEPNTSFNFNAELVVGLNQIKINAITGNSTNSTVLNVSVFEKGAESEADILALWPQLIGATQTGTIEFISSMAGSYTVYAGHPAVNVLLASGHCSQGWNLVEFYGGSIQQKECELFVIVNQGQPAVAGRIRVVPDLTVRKGYYSTDIDSDVIKISYKSRQGGTITAKGRTLFVNGGGSDDTLTIQVKNRTLSGDKTARICGIISDGGFSVLSVQGTLDILNTAESVKTLKVRNGSLGQAGRTHREQVRFASPRGKARIKVSNGNIYANIFCGDSKGRTHSLAGITVNKGNIGQEGQPHWIRAKSIGACVVKSKNGQDGAVRDYSFYLQGQTPSGRSESIGKLIVGQITDSSPDIPYTKIVCGYSSDTNPQTLLSSITDTAQYSLGKLIVRDGRLEGTYIVSTLPRKADVPVINNAIWIIN